MPETAMKIPETLEEAVEMIKAWDGVDEWVELDAVDTAIGIVHHGSGRRIRNAWGLWTGSKLAEQLYERFGLTHADDMSGLILHCAWRELNGLPWEAEAKVAEYDKFWAEHGGKPERPWLQTA